MDRPEVENQFVRLQQMMLERGTSGVGWMGIDVAWERLAKRDGGTVKRNGSYGRFTYEYRGEPLTLEQAILEVLKPHSLRQALIEAEAVEECTMCGHVVVGREAMEAFYKANIVEKGGVYYDLGVSPRWASLTQTVSREYRRFVFCPQCLARIARGDYRK